jgi:hypothetical protein
MLRRETPLLQGRKTMSENKSNQSNQSNQSSKTNQDIEDIKNTVTEELEMIGSQVGERLQDLIKQGNVRRVILRTSDDRVLMDTTLTVGAVAGGAFALIAGPFVTAIAAIAAIVGRVKIEIVREIADGDVLDGKARIQITDEE